jgi:hypothetical protein
VRYAKFVRRSVCGEVCGGEVCATKKGRIEKEKRVEEIRERR